MKYEIIENRGDWKVLNRREAYKNRFGLTVIHDNVVRPDGEEGIYSWIAGMNSGVYVLPIDTDKKVHLVDVFKYPLNRFSLEAASGGKNEKESFLYAAKRELKEELGIKAKKWTKLADGLEPAPHVISGSNQALFLAQDLYFEENCLEGTETIKHVVMPLEEAVESVYNGRITEIPTALIIMMANDHLRNKLKIK